MNTTIDRPEVITAPTIAEPFAGQRDNLQPHIVDYTDLLAYTDFYKKKDAKFSDFMGY